MYFLTSDYNSKYVTLPISDKNNFRYLKYAKALQICQKEKRNENCKYGDFLVILISLFGAVTLFLICIIFVIKVFYQNRGFIRINPLSTSSSTVYKLNEC